MKSLKNIILISCFILIILTCNKTLAATDEFKAFISQDIYNDYSTGQYTAREAIAIAERVFRNKLNYINSAGANSYTITNSADTVKNYISHLGNNYALVTFSHGDDGAFTMGEKNGVAQWIAYDNNTISGYWHLIFINSCNSMKTDKLAQAFKTIGYSNRAALGWYSTVGGPALKYWWASYEQYAGKYSVSEAAVKAANDCIDTPYSTPIRAYGDKNNWNGKAW